MNDVKHDLTHQELELLVNHIVPEYMRQKQADVEMWETVVKNYDEPEYAGHRNMMTKGGAVMMLDLVQGQINDAQRLMHRLEELWMAE